MRSFATTVLVKRLPVHVIGTDDTPVEGKYKVNILGEYNIGGDAFEIERILKKCGFTLIATFSGNSTVDSFRHAHGPPGSRRPRDPGRTPDVATPTTSRETLQ